MRWLMLGLSMLVFWGANMTHKQLLEQLPLKEDVNGSVSLFPAEFLQLTSFGHDALAADMLWLELIQYYGAASQEEQPFTYLYDYFDTLTTLQPQFEQAYILSAYLMAERPEETMKILKKGIKNNPQSAQIHFQAGFVSYLHLQQNEEASEYFERASELDPDGIGPNAARFAAKLYEKTGRGECEVALSLWQRAITQAPNKSTRERAERQFIERRMLCEVKVLKEQVDAYAQSARQKFKQAQAEQDEENPLTPPASFFPPSLAALLQREEGPKDPLGRFYVYTSDKGSVQVKPVPWTPLNKELTRYFTP